MRILITDDHALFREATVFILQQLDSDVSVLEAGDAKSALSLVKHYGPFDLALFDMRLPDLDGVTAISRCLSLSPQTPIVAISGDEELRLIDAAIAAGAAGFVPKSANSREFIAALRQVLAGDIYLPTRFLDLHPPVQLGGIERLCGCSDGTPPCCEEHAGKSVSDDITLDLAASQPPVVLPDPPPVITGRQLQVLQLIGRGLSNKAIGIELEISEGTVKQHVSKLLRKLGARNRTEAVAAAAQLGQLPAKR